MKCYLCWPCRWAWLVVRVGWMLHAICAPGLAVRGAMAASFGRFVEIRESALMNAVCHSRSMYGSIPGAWMRRHERREKGGGGTAGVGELVCVLLFALGGCMAPPPVLPSMCGDGVV